MNIIILFIYIHGSKEDFKIETLMHYTQKDILIGLFRMMAEIAIVEETSFRIASSGIIAVKEIREINWQILARTHERHNFAMRLRRRACTSGYEVRSRRKRRMVTDGGSEVARRVGDKLKY